MGLLYLTKRMEFSSSHFYFHPGRTPEENLREFGKESRTHGHNYLLELTLEGKIDPMTGMVINTVDLKEMMQELLVGFDHKHLNLDTPWFKEQAPTTDRLARTLGELFQKAFPKVRLSRVRLYENEGLFSDFSPTAAVPSPGREMILSTRTYRFSAAHRLHTPKLSDAENLRIYGKCNNPNSHGHNYVLDVTLKGAAGEKPEQIENLDRFDGIIRKEVSDRYDHYYLDRDFEEFNSSPSTAENILVIIWNRLSPLLSGRLHKLKLVETRDNYFEYYG